MVTSIGRISSTIFHQIVLAAPDIDTQVFARDIAPKLISGYPKVTLYASSRDRPLLLSTMIHHAARAGYISGIPVILKDMDTIDVTEVDTTLLGHSYYADNDSVLSDLFGLLNEGSLPPRFNLILSLDGTYWIMKK
jgi:esterase/lipase superfamily enzyme